MGRGPILILGKLTYAGRFARTAISMISIFVFSVSPTRIPRFVVLRDDLLKDDQGCSVFQVSTNSPGWQGRSAKQKPLDIPHQSFRGFLRSASATQRRIKN